MLGFLLTAFSLAPAAQAGSWQFSVTGTMNASTSPTSTVPGYTLPAPSTGSVSLPSYNLYGYVPVGAGQTASGNADFSLPLTVTATWIANPNLSSDPAPASLRVVESASTSWSVTGGCFTVDTTGSTASDGLGDASINNFYSGTSSGSNHLRQLSVTSGGSASWTVTLSAHASVTIAHAPFNTGCGVNAYLNSYSVSVAPITAAVKVDQDQQVFAPAATTHFSATFSNMSGFTVDGVQIIVDGAAPITATMTPNNPNNYYINWDSSTAGNPSEHTVEAKAQVHDSIGSVSLDSTAALGNGRLADDIIADLRLKAFTFNNSLPLRYSASASSPPTPDPALVPPPQWTYDANGNQTANFTPMAYQQNTAIPFSIELYPLTGSATVGYTLDLSTKPLDTNEAGLALYQTGTTPQTFSNPLSLTSKVALYKEVNKYATTLADLRFWVQFTKSTHNWAIVSTYADAGHVNGNGVYALVGNPSAPMAQTWISVLDYACQYAAGTSDALSATTALTKGLYSHGHYNGGVGGNTGPFVDGQEDFYPAKFISAALIGQCNDFADFLCCMSCGVGALSLQPQRSASVADYNNGSGFITKPITWSPTQSTAGSPAPGSPVSWSYHQWTGTNIFDGCLLFGGTTSPINMALSDYHNSLVAVTVHINNPALDWDPQPLMTLNVK